MTAVKQLSINNPTIQAYETYVVTNDDYGESSPVYVFLPISQNYGKNPRWIQYSPATQSFATFYFTATELKHEIQKLADYGGSKMKLYVLGMNWGESLPFKLTNINEIQRDLVTATTMKGHRTRAPAKKAPVKVNFKRMI